jgi:ABC-type thiamine transport system ATPase subunit
MKSHKIVRLGIGRTFQTATVFEQLSVLQNLDIAAGCTASGSLLLARGKVPERVEQALETIGLTAHAHRPAGILAHGQKQWLEVGMLLVQDAQVMFLDETVAGMSTEEREETGELLSGSSATAPSSSSSTTWSSCALRRLRDRHARRQGARRGHRRRDPGRPAGAVRLPGHRHGGAIDA